MIAASVDDRNEEERGLKVNWKKNKLFFVEKLTNTAIGNIHRIKQPLKNAKFVIPKSRYGSISCFISTDARLRAEYNDIDLVYDKQVYLWDCFFYIMILVNKTVKAENAAFSKSLNWISKSRKKKKIL